MDSKQEICSVLGKKLIDYIFEVKGIGKIGNPYKLGKPYIFKEPYDRHRSQHNYREPHEFPEIYGLHGFRKPYTFRELYELHQLYELHELRKKWNAGYPIAYDRGVTYRLVNEMGLTIEILPTLIEIALNESHDCFYWILLRIDSLLPDYHRIPCPSGFNEHLLRLHDKVKQYSFVPYLIELWDQLIEKARYYIPSEPVSLYKSFLKQLEVSPDAFLNYFLIPLPNIVKDEQCVCPASMDRITEEGNKTCFAGSTCSSEYYLTTTRSFRWWVFRCKPNAPNFIYIGYVYVRQDGSQEIEVGRWQSHCHPMTKSEILVKLSELEFEYYREYAAEYATAVFKY